MTIGSSFVQSRSGTYVSIWISSFLRFGRELDQIGQRSAALP